ncbi:MAG TPA: zf-HC2 domain-containing protein [Thermoanaerobaculia bacterium]|nr:zf-HC2 domain-containing protein [Thermoanaerobaculia bacterium]
MGQPRENLQAPDIPCPALETLAAFIDGALSGARRRQMISHLSRCRGCYRLFAETLRSLLWR